MPPSQKVLQRSTSQQPSPTMYTLPPQSYPVRHANPWYQAFICNAAPTLTAACRTVVAPHAHQESATTVPL